MLGFLVKQSGFTTVHKQFSNNHGMNFNNTLNMNFDNTSQHSFSRFRRQENMGLNIPCRMYWLSLLAKVV